VRVFVVNRGEGVLLIAVESQKDVVVVLRGEKVAREVQLPFREIRLGLNRLKALCVFCGVNLDGYRRVGVQLGKERLENPAHALELVENMASLLLAGVGENDEMAAAYLGPFVRSSGCGRTCTCSQQQESNDLFAHVGDKSSKKSKLTTSAKRAERPLVRTATLSADGEVF
jgi:hypothetical protein